MKRKHKRLTFVAVALVLLAASTAMFLSAIEENITLFVSPTDVVEKKYAQDRGFRLGGLVDRKSVV